VSTVTIHEAKATLSKLIEKALSGEEIIIARRNKPLVKIVPLVQSATHRKIGSAKGQLTIASDFDAIPPGFEDYL
jgi:prevent-host-death family protein